MSMSRNITRRTAWKYGKTICSGNLWSARSPVCKKKLERKESREMELELRQLQEQLEEIPELKPVRFFADDCSSEALTSLMAANNGVFSVISTEGGIFDIMAGRYSNKSNIDVWLKGHCGDAIYVDRMTREAECIMHPALSAILSIQPSVLDEIMSNTTMTGRGLIARFLYASPPSRIGSRVFRTQPIPPEITAVYRSLIFSPDGSADCWKCPDGTPFRKKPLI